MRHAENASGGVIKPRKALLEELPAAANLGREVGAALSSEDRSKLAADVRRAIRARRDRESFLPNHLFADPAWDMMLALYSAELAQVRLTVSNLCDASHVPSTTALRWISSLVNEGLAVRRRDPLDARRIWVCLSARGLRDIHGYFELQARGY